MTAATLEQKTGTQEIENESEDTRALARDLIQKIRNALENRKALLLEIEVEKKRLADMAADVLKREQTLDPEDLDAIRDVRARREQLDLLTKKLSVTITTRLAEADALLTAIGADGDNIESLFSELSRELTVCIAAALRPFIHRDAQAALIARQTDAVVIFGKYRTWASRGIESVNEAERLADFLQNFLNGKVPWIFNRTE